MSQRTSREPSDTSAATSSGRGGGNGKWLLLLGALAAGAGYLAYKRSTEKVDPWATAGSYTPPVVTAPVDEESSAGEEAPETAQ